MHKTTFLTALFSLIFIGLRAQQPAIFTEERITQLGPGIYSTDYCDGNNKLLWADSTAGYTSYLWSTGATTPLISIGTTVPMMSPDTLTLTVGLSQGGTATSEVRLYPSFVLLVQKVMYPASQMACPGAMDFSFENHQLDSFVVFNNGMTMFAPFNPNCATVNFTVPASPSPAGIRYLTNGCAISMSAGLSIVFPTTIAPTVTQNGNTYSATHPAYTGTQFSVFRWRNTSGSNLATGTSYNPAPGTSFYVVLENTAFMSLGPASQTCVAFNPQVCTTAPSPTFTYVVIGMADANAANPVLFPNPTQGLFEIADLGADVGEVRVIDLQGRQVATLARTNSGFDAGNLGAGLYWVQWMENDVLRQTRLAVAR